MGESLNFKGVLIDFGYTLAHINNENVRRYRESLFSILMKHGYSKTLDDLALVLENTYRSSSEGKAKNIYEFWKLLLKNLEVFENITLIRELTELREDYWETRWILYDKAVQVLSTLKMKYELALVSNCFVGLSDILSALNLTPFFKHIILSYDVGVTKPDKQIYLIALRKLGLQPNECIFVSDQISDLEGAREVRLKTFLVHQGPNIFHEANDRNFKPDYQCNHIFEIIKFL